MILALDVGYATDLKSAVVGAVLFDKWTDEKPVSAESIRLTMDIAPYEPGFFYKRELPCLLAALEHLGHPKLEAVVVDGLVDLERGHSGLGRHLFNQLPTSCKATCVVGVAKTPFHGAVSLDLLHGGSHKPLYVNAAGMTNRTASKHIASMHGPNRIPTLLKLADHLSRA